MAKRPIITTMTDPRDLYESVDAAMSDVLVGNDDVVEGLLVALLTRGHVLLEGVPGVGKTTIATLFANATGLAINRIQMTPDVLPADITGTSVYRETTGDFEIREGPVFANLVVADEINRATAKTQSALLEAMQELQVTIEGTTRQLPQPFMLLATQNPIEMDGTFELPVAQRDRFQQKLRVSLPERDTEGVLLDRFADDPTLGPGSIDAAIDPSTIRDARATVETVYVADSIKEYVLDLVDATRTHHDVRHGASPRASITMINVARAYAAIDGRDYVIPDDVKGPLPLVLGHRLVLETAAELGDVRAQDVVDEIRRDVSPPGSHAEDGRMAQPTD